MNAKEFPRRRKQLMRMMDNDSIAIVPAAPECIRNRDVEYPYRPDSDFFYLTGFPESGAVAILMPGRAHGEVVLFCQDRDPEVEAWTGERAGPEGACELYGADDAFPIDDIDDILPGLLEGRARVYYTMGCNSAFDARVLGWVKQIRKHGRAGQRTPTEFVSMEHLLHDMRLYKSRSEISAMRRAAGISMKAHRRAMKECVPGMMEYELESVFAHEFRGHGAEHAYTPIVGGGANGCVLHYTRNNQALQDKELVLIDAGAEYDCYASDITRTFPVNGRFTRAQRAIYEIVLEAQQAAIEEVKPGNHWNDPHDAAVRVLTKGMVALGILKGSVPQLIKKEAYKNIYMHRTGHWLGMDVHDVGDYKVGGRWRVLEPGMTLTVEPGMYIPVGTKGVARKWWNIGVRIEDDVLVTKNGNEVLTGDLVKDPDEIESWMA